MAQKTTIYDDFALERGVLEARIAQAISSSQNYAKLEVRITAEEKINRKYRGKSMAGKFTVEISDTESGGHELEQLYIRKYRPGPDAEETFRFDRELSDILYKCIDHDLQGPGFKTHKHTHSEKDQQRAIPAFPKPLGTQYPFFEKDLMTMTRFERNKDAFDLRAQKEVPETTLLNYVFDLSMILLDRIPYFVNSYPKLKTLPFMSGKKDEFGKDRASYTFGFRSILSSMTLTGAEKEKASNALNQLAEKYLDREDLRTIIMKDSYPWHNNGVYFFDVGKLCWGSRGLHFGALFGHPDVFLKIADQSTISNLFRDYQSKREKLMTQFHMEFNRINSNLMEKSFYVGAICANANLLEEYRDRMSSQEVADTIKAMNLQMSSLSDLEMREKMRNGAARSLYEVFEGKEGNVIMPSEGKLSAFLKRFLGGSQ